MKCIYAFVTFLSVAHVLQAAVVQKFPFDIGTHALYRPLGLCYIGSLQAIDNNDLAVAVAERTDTIFRGITPQKVALNTRPDSSNPLHGQAIIHLSLLERRPVVVPQNFPSSLFLIDDRRSPIAVFQSAPLKNSNGIDAPSILSVTTTASELDRALEAGASLAAIAAVPNARGGFDGDGSGIALAWFRQIAQQGSTSFAWDIVDASTGVSSFQNGFPTEPVGNKAAPFSKDTEQLMIASPVATIADSVDLHFDRDLGRLYIATQVTAGNSSKSGGRAVVVASVANGRLRYQALAPDSVFSGADQIVGKVGNSSKTSIFKVRTMQVKTHLRYLIVVGGNGDDPALQQKVFALPLVDNIASPETHGTLAHVQSQPVTLFQDEQPHRFRGRVFAVPAQKPDEVYTMNSLQARVGGQAVLPGEITDIHIAGEAVFVACTINAQLNSEKIAAGIFHSQPLFDHLGRISGWTDWQRTATTDTPVAGFEYDPMQVSTWSISQEKLDEINHTRWSDGSDQLGAFISSHFLKEKGGVQGLFDFPYTTNGFSLESAERISVECYTGHGQLFFTQTGKETSGIFKPFENLQDMFISTDGSLKGFVQSPNILFSGGELDLLGPITSAAIVTDGATGWFVVAGVGGVAILTDENGIGWDMKKGLATGFVGLSNEARWKRVSSTPFVRKLLVEDGKLFALSLTTLERYLISRSNLVSATVNKVIVSQLTDAQKENRSTYSDMYIKGPLALLATSFGLMRSGDGADIRSQDRIPWISVPLKESVGALTDFGPVSRFYKISSSAQSGQDSLYLLNGYVGLDQSLMYRLVVTLENGQVTSNSVKLFPDYTVRDIHSFFANCGEYRNYLVTDGSFIGVSRSKDSDKSPLVQLLSPTFKSGENARQRVPITIVPEDARTIGQIVRNSASGAWMVTGDFGIRVQR